MPYCRPICIGSTPAQGSMIPTAAPIAPICDESVKERVSAHENLKKTGVNSRFKVGEILYIVTVFIYLIKDE